MIGRSHWTLCDLPDWAKDRNKMPLNLDLMESAVRIIGTVPAPNSPLGERREPIGTGFFVTVPSEVFFGHIRYGYVVTAHHVLWDQSRMEVQAPDPSTAGATLHPPVEVSDWRQPLDNVDLAIAPFGGHQTALAYQALRMEAHVLPPEDLPALGSRIFYVGILTPLDRPMARAGSIGALEQTGIPHDGGYEYEAHLVDCRSYGGFSGSPCFVELSYPSLTPLADPPETSFGPLGDMRYNAKLCGMFTEHLVERNDPIVSKYGVGTMLPSHKLWEALMTDDMKKERRGWDAEHEAEARKLLREGPQMEGAASSSKDEYARFEELARQLANTPKPKDDESGAD